jgi:hypothetical protein
MSLDLPSTEIFQPKDVASGYQQRIRKKSSYYRSYYSAEDLLLKRSKKDKNANFKNIPRRNELFR